MSENEQSELSEEIKDLVGRLADRTDGARKNIVTCLDNNIRRMYIELFIDLHDTNLLTHDEEERQMLLAFREFKKAAAPHALFHWEIGATEGSK